MPVKPRTYTVPEQVTKGGRVGKGGIMSEHSDLYQIDVGYAVFGIQVNNLEHVTKAAPIGKWMLGKHISDIERLVAKKRGKVTHVERIESPFLR